MSIQLVNDRQLARAAVIAGACVALAACRGGSSLPPAVQGIPATGSAARGVSPHASIPVTVSLVVPTGKAALERRLGNRSPFFVALGTKGAKVVAYAHGNRTTPLATVVANVAANSSICSSGAARVCALKLSLSSAGKVDFVTTTYDQSPTGNTIPATAKQLGAGVEVKGIRSKGKTITVVVGGVVASTSLFLSQGAVSSIDATKFSAVVVARDADGNAIVTDSYESATGSHVKITLGSSGNPSFGFSPNNFSTAAKGLAVTVSYRPSGVTGAQVQNGFSTVLTATADNGATVGSATFAALAPHVTEFTTPTAASEPFQIAPGSDGAMWFTELVPGNVARIPTGATSATQITEFTIPTAGAHPFGLVNGPDGQIWFAEQGGNKIGHLPVTATSGSDISEITLPNPGSVPTGITAGSDGALYFTEAGINRVGRIPTSATSTSAITEIALPIAVSHPFGISTASDGTIWFAESDANIIAHMPSGATLPSQITQITLPTGGSLPLGIAPGAGGTTIAAERSNAKIASAPSGASTTSQVTEFSTGAAQPYGTVLGPDGAIWFTEAVGNKIGRIATDGTLVEFTVPTPGALTGIATGPDGSIWFTEVFNSKIGRIQ